MEARWRELSDDLGPAKILLVRDAAAGLEGVVVVDNVAAGPAIGGSAWPPTSPSRRSSAWRGR
jgi:hypothetical protein